MSNSYMPLNHELEDVGICSRCGCLVYDEGKHEKVCVNNDIVSYGVWLGFVVWLVLLMLLAYKFFGAS